MRGVWLGAGPCRSNGAGTGITLASVWALCEIAWLLSRLRAAPSFQAALGPLGGNGGGLELSRRCVAADAVVRKVATQRRSWLSCCARRLCLGAVPVSPGGLNQVEPEHPGAYEDGDPQDDARAHPGEQPAPWGTQKKTDRGGHGGRDKKRRNESPTWDTETQPDREDAPRSRRHPATPAFHEPLTKGITSNDDDRDTRQRSDDGQDPHEPRRNPERESRRNREPDLNGGEAKDGQS